MPQNRSRRRARTLTGATAVALAAAALVALPQSGAEAAPAGRTETPLVTHSPDDDVAVSQVTLAAPLPKGFGAHPAACDTLSYLRYRSVRGPAAPTAADRVLVAQPGALAGAASLDGIARHTVENAAAQGRSVEFWALDRRANCLDDTTGLTAAVAANDPQVALDYYYRGAVVNGRRFAGFVPQKQLGWLSKMGVQQSVLDWHTLLLHELPDPAFRASKVWCGGHSLGGLVTGFFAASDFDGNPATTADAGYNQCAGFFALDSQVATSIDGTLPAPAAVPALVRAGRRAVDGAYASGVLPRSLDIPVVNAETLNSLAITAVFAQLRPQEVSPVATFFKGNRNVTTAMRFLISKDAGAFLTGLPSAYDFRFTNEAALGALMDDNSQPIAALQASVGFATGGRLAAKSFPTGNDLLRIPQLTGLTQPVLGTARKVIPDDPGPLWARGTGPVYRWLNYDQVTSAHGKPWTTPASEVTDIGDLARDMAEYPLDFTEHYFPTAMFTDTLLWAAGDRGVVPTAVHLDEIGSRPTFTILGADGLVVPFLKGRTPKDTLVLPGYQHLDVLTAAKVQNDGRREPGAAALTKYVLAH